MAIIAPTQKIAAVVEVIGQVKQGEFGQYRPILFVRSDRPKGSEEAKVWKSMGLGDADLFFKGQSVNLIPTERKGKATWDVEILDHIEPPKPLAAPPVPPTAPPATGLDPATKRAIAADITELANLYAYCLGEAKRSLAPHDPTPEMVQGCTAALFIDITRKYRL